MERWSVKVTVSSSTDSKRVSKSCSFQRRCLIWHKITSDIWIRTIQRALSCWNKAQTFSWRHFCGVEKVEKDRIYVSFIKLHLVSLSDEMYKCWKQPEPQAAQPDWIWRERSSQAHVEQRPRTWIIKLSCVLITPSKRPGRSQEARETLRMMRLISRVFFFFCKGMSFLQRWMFWARFKHGSTQIKSFCISKITLSDKENTADRRCRSSDNQMFYLAQLKSDLLFFCIKGVDSRTITLQLQLQG